MEEKNAGTSLKVHAPQTDHKAVKFFCDVCGAGVFADCFVYYHKAVKFFCDVCGAGVFADCFVYYG